MKQSNNLQYYAVSFIFLLLTGNVAANVEDDPLLTMVMVEQLELDVSDSEQSMSWSAQGWLGYDLHKIWLKTEGERVTGTTSTAELQLLYSRAIAPFWDLQFGIRKSLKPTPSNEWAVIGIQGLAPYYFEIDAALFVGVNGESAFRFDAEYEVLITQKLIVSTSVEFNLYGQNDQATGVGSGLSDCELGIRLRYEVVREFAPYIGVNWSKKYGNTAQYTRLLGEPTSENQIVLGLRVWF